MVRGTVFTRWLTASVLLIGLGIPACVSQSSSSSQASPSVVSSATPTPSAIATTPTPNDATLVVLQESWRAYRERFIQADGRVIDREAGDRTTSEAQAYAMLRAVMIDDPDTFEQTLDWAENNLQRRGNDGSRSDSLWSWTWGRNSEGIWGVTDPNFASDADVDAVTALILASRRWNRPDYLELARTKLKDIWDLSTVQTAPAGANGKGETRYLIPGPRESFQPQTNRLYLNPSYLAPYAFRLFAQVDRDRNWMSLVESSYAVLKGSAQTSAVGLPSDWVVLDTANKTFSPVQNHPSLRSIYGFDSYRVWWRVALDAAWFDEPAARQYLQEHLLPLQAMWRSRQAIPAQLDLQGQPLVNYESTAQYAMLYAGFNIVDPGIAEQILQQKINPVYSNGMWDNDSAYYTQNLSWFGLLSSTEVALNWLQP